jgi:hypothetical protein
MPNVKISDLSAASTPLSGTEELPIVQSGTTVKATAQDVADLASSFSVENAGNTPKITSDVFSSRPVSDTLGAIYISTDTDEIYQYNGSNWDLLGGIVQTITSSTLTVDSTDPKNPTVDLGYDVYTALLSNASGVLTIVELQNTLGVVFNWTIPFVGTLRATAASGTPFTLNKTWLTSGGQSTGSSNPYIVASAVRASNPTTQAEWRFFLHDGTISSTPDFTNFSIEIRVYP